MPRPEEHAQNLSFTVNDGNEDGEPGWYYAQCKNIKFTCHKRESFHLLRLNFTREEGDCEVSVSMVDGG